MEQVLVLILSGQSLFAEGIANRLRAYPDKVNVQMLDPREPGASTKIAETNPAVIILDANDHEASECCPLNELIFNHPCLKVMRLDSQKDMMQMVSSEQFRVVDADDLIQMIVPANVA